MNLSFHRASLALATGSLLALGACEESSTGSDLAPEGSLAFTFAGAATGSYSATGRFNRLRPDQGTFAVGGRGELQSGEEALVVYAHAVRADERADEFLLSLEDPQVGAVTCEVEDTSCPFGAFFFVGADIDGDTEAIYGTVSGTLTITSLNEDRARGEFTLQLEQLELSEEPPILQVTSGTFDVPIVQGTN